MQADELGNPLAVILSKVSLRVKSVIETWRIEDEWWRSQPVSRAYWRLLLDDGRTIDVYFDRLRKRWYRQTYS